MHSHRVFAGDIEKEFLDPPSPSRMLPALSLLTKERGRAGKEAGSESSPFRGAVYTWRQNSSSPSLGLLNSGVRADGRTFGPMKDKRRDPSSYPSGPPVGLVPVMGGDLLPTQLCRVSPNYPEGKSGVARQGAILDSMGVGL